MQAPTKTLPDGYQLYKKIDLASNKAVLLALNLATLGLYFILGLLFYRLAIYLRPQLTQVTTPVSAPAWVLSVLAGFATVLILHELVHGLFFWLTTSERPLFGVRSLYAYASAPDWYLPRIPYLAVGLAPLVLLTLLGFSLIPVVPHFLFVYLLFSMVVNAAGALGDVLIVAWLLTQPASTLVRDEGDAFFVYRTTGQG